MPTIKLKDFEIEGDTLELIQLASSFKDMVTESLVVKLAVNTEEAWIDIYDDHNNDIHPEYNLHMIVEHNYEKDIAIILIWALIKAWPQLDMPDIIRKPVFGDKPTAIRAAIKLWDEYNKPDVIAEFITNHKAKSKPAEEVNK